MAETPLYRYLDTNGDGTGTKDATGNYSVTPEEFYIQPQSGETLTIRRIIVSVGDTSGMQAQEYGNLGAALTNGVQVQLFEDNTAGLSLVDGELVKTNADWGALCYDVDLKSWGSGNELLVVRWTFTKATPGGIVLVSDRDAHNRLVVKLNDDFTGLLSHKFMAQGATSG